MASGLLSSLPQPVKEYAPVSLTSSPESTTTTLVSQTHFEPPPYGSAERRKFVPRKPRDFGDGGAFPEIQVAQYPLEMGKSDQKSGTKTLATTVGADGNINFDAIVKQGRNKDKHIASSHNAMVPKLDKLKDNMERPDQEEVEATMKETQAALDQLVSGKVMAQQPKTLPQQPGAPTYLKYKPLHSGPQFNSGAEHRIIKMQDMPVDPMEPPKFRHKKVPRSTGSPPVPVMHSPPRAVSAKEQQDWKIPPCISNWKNAKGYTIPLDKRLAADGRGLQETAINDGFAKFTEALYVAEQNARQAVELRSRLQREIAAKEKEAKERELRDLAMRARMDRVGGGAHAPAASRGAGTAATGATAREEEDEALPPPPPPGRERESKEERAERMRREEIREERRRERERERRLEAKDAHGHKKSKLTRDRERDISEKIALGQANVRSQGEALYDQRLFNQDGGMDSGLAADDQYNLYSKPLFTDRGSNLYRPNKAQDDELHGGEGGDDKDVRSERFKPTKGFAGVDYGTKDRSSGPVQFERDPAEAVEADPFGLDQIISEVAGSSKGRKKNALDGIGGGGSMRASGGGGSYEDYAGGSSRSRMDFRKGSD
ncbi:g13476 [Coccomyxa viridis]|uniref:G13476 protein n=1 Tax=Coccomyxa viridis TaxID=1274662 RepID=A0ABP1GCV0_9CHLO